MTIEYLLSYRPLPYEMRTAETHSKNGKPRYSHRREHIRQILMFNLGFNFDRPKKIGSNAWGSARVSCRDSHYIFAMKNGKPQPKRWAKNLSARNTIQVDAPNLTHPIALSALRP